MMDANELEIVRKNGGYKGKLNRFNVSIYVVYYQLDTAIYLHST